MSNLNLYKALLAAQANFPTIDKDGKNPHYKSAYATLPNVLNCTLPSLREQGILFTASEVDINGQQYMSLSLIHAESGEQITSNVKLLNCVDMQKYGSATTYAIRYGILAMLGISPDLDDDGNKSMLTDDKKPTQQANSKQPAKQNDVLNQKQLYTLLAEKQQLMTKEALDKTKAAIESNVPATLLKVTEYLINLGI